MSIHRDLNALIRDARQSEEPSPSERALVRRALALRLAAVPELSGTEPEPVQPPGPARSGGLLRSATSRTALTFAVLPAVALSVWWAVYAAPKAAVAERFTEPHSVSPPTSAPGAVRALPSASVDEVHEHEVHEHEVHEHEVAPAARREPSGARSTGLPRAPRKRAAAAAPQAAHNLAAESRALASVQRALRDADPARALGLLDEQDRVFAEGLLGEERVAARVLAACDSGDVAGARRLAIAFLAEHPSSPLRARVTASCVGTE